MLALKKYERALENYTQTGHQLSVSLIKAANRSFESGELDFFQYLQTLERAVLLKVDYLENLSQYNVAALSLNYLTH